MAFDIAAKLSQRKSAKPDLLVEQISFDLTLRLSFAMRQATVSSFMNAPSVSPNMMRDQPRNIIQSQWFAFVFLVPFLVMLGIHRLLGFSDALMVQTPSGEREAHTYNLVMVAVFYFGVAASFIHTLVFPGRAGVWLFSKLGALVLYWILIVKFA